MTDRLYFIRDNSHYTKLCVLSVLQTGKSQILKLPYFLMCLLILYYSRSVCFLRDPISCSNHLLNQVIESLLEDYTSVV